MRLAHLDQVGVARQVVGFTGSSYDGVLSPDEAKPFWRAQNDDTAELVRTHPTRFLGLATLPTGDVAAAAAELDRAHTELGLIGGTLPLDAFIQLESARALAPILAVAQKHRSHLYVHRGEAAPTIPGQTPEVGATNAYFGLPTTRQPNGGLPDLPGDHAWARSTLITSTHLAAGAITLSLTDLLDPYPDVTVQLTMIGGSIAHLAEAIEQRTDRDGLASPHTQAPPHLPGHRSHGARAARNRACGEGVRGGPHPLRLGLRSMARASSPSSRASRTPRSRPRSAA